MLIRIQSIRIESYERDSVFWIDELPRGRDREIDVEREVAWRSPLYREAVKRALGRYK